MRKSIKIYLFALAGILVFNACEDILTLEPRDEISSAAIWNDLGLIEAYLSEAYFGTYHGANQRMTDAFTDNAGSVPPGRTNSVVQGTLTPSSMGDLLHNTHLRWDWNYQYIRHVNNILTNIEDSPIDEADKRLIKGQALYLRAHFYHNLWKTNGGVPNITQVYSLEDEDLTPPRNSFKETVEFIVDDLEAAADLLPDVWPDGRKGRATIGSALALKSRVLLYAASDLFHDNPGGIPETGYVEAQDREAFWRASKNAAQDVIDLNLYELHHAEPSPGDSIEEIYYRMFLTPVNSETIFEKYYTGTERRGRNANFTPNTYHGPNGFHSWGGTTPTQQFVDYFQMNDGSEFDWDNPAHAASPYENRDPRFHATILYDGAPWTDRSDAGIQADPVGVIQTFFELTLPGGITVPGLDTRNSPIDDWNGTESGYYMRKWLNEDIPLRTRPIAGVWIWIRYAEILLNYAEASIQLGEEDDARWALNKLRRRVGMPEYGNDVTGQDLIDQMMYERRVELSFEEQRYFDVRRWMIAPQVMEDAQGIIIRAEATDRRYRSTYFNYTYEIMTFQERTWFDKMYYFPIHQSEIDRNGNLDQNPGY